MTKLYLVQFVLVLKVLKVKYLGVYIVFNTALTDISSHVRQF